MQAFQLAKCFCGAAVSAPAGCRCKPRPWSAVCVCTTQRFAHAASPSSGSGSASSVSAGVVRTAFLQRAKFLGDDGPDRRARLEAMLDNRAPGVQARRALPPVRLRHEEPRVPVGSTLLCAHSEKRGCFSGFPRGTARLSQRNIDGAMAALSLFKITRSFWQQLCINAYSDLAQGHLRRLRYDRPPAPHPNPDPNPTLPCRRQRRSRTRCGALSQTAARRSLWACRSSCSRPCTTPLASTPSPSPDDQSSRACACARRPHASRRLLSGCAGVPASLLPGGRLRCCACVSQCES